MYVPGLSVNLLSVSTLEDEGYAVMFEDGQVLVRSEGADTQDAIMKLSIRQGTMCRLLGQHVVGSKGILDRGSMLKTKCIGHEDLSSFVRTRSWYEMRLMGAQE